MSDNNQQIIEAMEKLQAKFKERGRYVSADIIHEEIESLKPKPQYLKGKAYIIKDSCGGVERPAIYLGDNVWSVFNEWTNKMNDYILCKNDEVFEVVKAESVELPQTVTTVEELDALPPNTILRSHSTRDIKDVAIKGLAGRWWQDEHTQSRPAYKLLEDRSTWEVVALG